MKETWTKTTVRERSPESPDRGRRYRLAAIQYDNPTPTRPLCSAKPRAADASSRKSDDGDDNKFVTDRNNNRAAGTNNGGRWSHRPTYSAWHAAQDHSTTPARLLLLLLQLLGLGLTISLTWLRWWWTLGWLSPRVLRSVDTRTTAIYTSCCRSLSSSTAADDVPWPLSPTLSHRSHRPSVAIDRHNTDPLQLTTVPRRVHSTNIPFTKVMIPISSRASRWYRLKAALSLHSLNTLSAPYRVIFHAASYYVSIRMEFSNKSIAEPQSQRIDLKK